MINSTGGLLPIQVRALSGAPIQVERGQRSWTFKPFRFFTAAGTYIGEIVHSTSPDHGIQDLAEAQAMATKMAVATSCCDVLRAACEAVDADIAATGSISAETARLASQAVATAREVERLVQA